MSFLASWGAVLSTILAAVKIWEAWQGRFHIDIGHSSTSDPEVGNLIIVRNLASRPIIVTYWELLTIKGRGPFRTETCLRWAQPDSEDSRIEAHQSLALRFSEQDHFEWGVRAAAHGHLCIRLHIAGRRPILRRVHG